MVMNKDNNDFGICMLRKLSLLDRMGVNKIFNLGIYFIIYLNIRYLLSIYYAYGYLFIIEIERWERVFFDFYFFIV